MERPSPEAVRLRTVVPLFRQFAAEVQATAASRYGTQEVQPGSIVEQKYVYIYEDRPVVKERVSHFVERTFVEREYVKQAKLRTERHLPQHMELLDRQLVAARHVSQDVVAPSPNAPITGGQQSDSAAASTPGADMVSGPTEGGPSPNPFRGFVQPDAPVGIMQPPVIETEVEEQKGEQPSGVLRSAKRRLLRPFKWQFTSKFKSVNDTENPALHQQLAEEDTAADEQRQPKAAAATTALAVPDQNSAQPEGSITLEGSLQPSAQKADTNGGADMQIQAEAEVEPHRMYFTQVEEHRVTKERVERFVEHNYFQLEYVIKVRFLAEHKGNQSLQLLSRQRFILDG